MCSHADNGSVQCACDLGYAGDGTACTVGYVAVSVEYTVCAIKADQSL
jgi:hypothetical protein